MESKQQQQNTTLIDRHGGGQVFCIFIKEKDGKGERYAMIFVANSTPLSTLCPCSNGSAVLKSGPEFLVFKINIIVRYIIVRYGQRAGGGVKSAIKIMAYHSLSPSFSSLKIIISPSLAILTILIHVDGQLVPP